MSRRWYGWQTILADLAVAALLVAYYLTALAQDWLLYSWTLLAPAFGLVDAAFSWRKTDATRPGSNVSGSFEGDDCAAVPGALSVPVAGDGKLSDPEPG